MAVKSSLPVIRSSAALEPVDPLRRYIREISQYPFLSPEEEKELALKFIDSGDKEAARKLVGSHLRLVVKIALEYKTAYGNVLDLVQEGNLGLMQAIKRFDPEKGARLSSYASWWIRSYILKYILDNFRLIKIGTTQAQRRIFFNLMRESERLEKEGFKPTSALIAEALDVKTEEVEEMKGRLQKSDFYLDTPLQEDSDKSHLDMLMAPQEDIDAQLDERNFNEVLEEKLGEFSKTLKPRETKIFKDRLLAEVPLTLQAIADEYGISRERARQIEEKIKEKLKNFFEKENIQVQEHLEG